MFTFVCLHESVCAHTRVCGGQNTVCGSQFSPPIIWIPGVKLRSSACGLDLWSPSPAPFLPCFGFAVQGTQSSHACHAGSLAVSCFGADSLYTLKLSCTSMIGVAWDPYPLLGDADTAVCGPHPGRGRYMEKTVPSATVGTQQANSEEAADPQRVCMCAHMLAEAR